jgi:hypothetical protein
MITVMPNSRARSLIPRLSLETSFCRFSAFGRGHQLQVVDDHEAQAVGADVVADLGAQAGQGEAGDVVDVERRGGDLLPGFAAARATPALSTMPCLRWCRATLAWAHSRPLVISSSLISSVWNRVGMPLLTAAARANPRCDRRLAHGGAGADDDHLPGRPAAAEEGVEVDEPGGGAVFLGGRGDAAFEGGADQFADVLGLPGGVGLGDSVEGVLEGGDVGVGVEGGAVAAAGGVVAEGDDACGDGLLRDAFGVPGGGAGLRPAVQLGELRLGERAGGHAAVGVPGLQLAGDGQPADLAVPEAGAEFLDGEPHPAVLLGGDVRGVEAFCGELVDDLGALHGGGDDDALGIHIARHARAELVGGLGSVEPRVDLGGHAASPRRRSGPVEHDALAHFDEPAGDAVAEAGGDLLRQQVGGDQRGQLALVPPVDEPEVDLFGELGGFRSAPRSSTRRIDASR